MLPDFRSLTRHKRGSTIVEYSLIAAIVAVAGIAAMQAIGVKAASANTVAVALTWPEGRERP